jgi:hypothetical protein
MTPEDLADILLEWNVKPPLGWLLDEASAHRPRRGARWVASFRNERGKQQWKTTGLTDYKVALRLAREWEEQARRKRASQGALAKGRSTTGRALGGLTQPEVAAVLQISVRAVRQIEHRAIEKLRQNPALRRLWLEYLKGEMEESVPGAAAYRLSFDEIVALFHLTATQFERQALGKLLDLMEEH